jgi:hypothetical protein
MFCGVLPLDHHVGLADGEGLVVQLLAEDLELGAWVQLVEVFLGHAQHAARAAGRVVQRLDHAGLAEHRVVLGEHQVDHQADDLARREVLTGRLVGLLGEAPDEVLEDGAHHVRVDHVRVQVHLAKRDTTWYSRLDSSSLSTCSPNLKRWMKISRASWLKPSM